MTDHVLTFSANLPKYNETAHSGVEQKTAKAATSNRAYNITSATNSPAGKSFVSHVRAFFHKPSKLVNAVRTFSLRSFIGKIRQVFSSSNAPQHVNETPHNHFVQKHGIFNIEFLLGFWKFKLKFEFDYEYNVFMKKYIESNCSWYFFFNENIKQIT